MILLHEASVIVHMLSKGDFVQTMMAKVLCQHQTKTTLFILYVHVGLCQLS